MMGVCVVGVKLFVVIVFFKQKTAYEMRISDWSSDVCASDLNGVECLAIADKALGTGRVGRIAHDDRDCPMAQSDNMLRDLARRRNIVHRRRQADVEEIGRASCRERVWQYV